MNASYLRRAVGLVVSDPAGGLDRIRNRIEYQLFFGDGEANPRRHEFDRHWEGTLHESIEAPWPCTVASDFSAHWRMLTESSLGASFRIGTGNDADIALARTAWCLVRHLRPLKVIETGVARGVLTRFILQGLAANGEGHLWSIDLPPVTDGWHAQSAAAVSEELKRRWTYVHGSSRRRLPGLLETLGNVDMLVHDSLHTARNMRFEFELAWPAIASGGALLADDVQLNDAFPQFARSISDGRAIIAPEETKSDRLFGIAIKNGR